MAESLYPRASKPKTQPSKKQPQKARFHLTGFIIFTQIQTVWEEDTGGARWGGGKGLGSSIMLHPIPDIKRASNKLQARIQDFTQGGGG